MPDHRNESTDMTASLRRGSIWQNVWTERDDDKADWNGFEKTVDSADAYDTLTTSVGELLRERLLLGPDDVVADLGCGTGRISDVVAPHVKKVLAFDYSETVLRVARERRSRSNIDYEWADLNDFDPAGRGLTKAYAASSFLYLDSAQVAIDLIARIHSLGIDQAILDVPDSNIPDRRPRDYDVTTFNHLRLDPAELLRRFPTARIGRGEHPGYVNADSRFNFYLMAE